MCTSATYRNQLDPILVVVDPPALRLGRGKLKLRHFISHSRNNGSFDPDSAADSERVDFWVVRSRPLWVLPVQGHPEPCRQRRPLRAILDLRQ